MELEMEEKSAVEEPVTEEPAVEAPGVEEASERSMELEAKAYKMQVAKQLVEDLVRDRATLDEREKALEEELPGLEKQAAEAEYSFPSLKAEVVVEAHAATRKLQKQLDAVQKEMDAAQKEIAGMLDECSKLPFFRPLRKKLLDKKVVRAQGELPDLTVQIRDLEHRIKVIRNRRKMDEDALHRKVDDVKYELAQKKAELEAMPEKKAKYEKMIAEGRKKIEALQG